ncbi:MAG TPA: hypothetical protein VHH73_15245 [Verrucomicrobiae bacterium]|nr:hypothetical protein [Verrucomicrobiae bacterium]
MKTAFLSLVTGLVVAATATAATPPRDLPDGYTLETIEIPSHITLGVGGLCFAPSGELYISTREGEVWKYRDGNWSLFADGLHEALGLYIDPKTSEVWVMQRPELTKLVDTDGDGKADVYQTVNGDWGLSDNYHEYAFGPVRDAHGNFYGTLNTTLSWRGWAGSDRWDVGRVHDSKMGRDVKYRGWCFQITPDGKFVPFASGMRSPAGITINKAGELFYTDNQGDWNCTSSLHNIVKGRFYGHPSSLMDDPAFAGRNLNRITVEEYDKLRHRPAVYFPHGELASSPGEPTFNETSGKFGPFEDEVFVGDQTKSNLMRAWLERVGGEYQGVIFDFADPLQCGVIRNRFAPDGSLWIGETGRGWRSVGDKVFGLQRIKWDGKTMPMEMHSVSLTKTGFHIKFTRAVDPATAARPENYAIKHWGYIYQGEYGSPKVGLTELNPSSVKLSADGKEAELQLPLVKERVYQFTLNNITGADGARITNPSGYYTLNRLRE